MIYKIQYCKSLGKVPYLKNLLRLKGDRFVRVSANLGLRAKRDLRLAFLLPFSLETNGLIELYRSTIHQSNNNTKTSHLTSNNLLLKNIYRTHIYSPRTVFIFLSAIISNA